MNEIIIAALYVMKNGPYYNLENVEPWGLPDKDAREYPGSYQVVAHPPCARWGRYWSGGPSAKVRRKLGDDDGCFDAALKAVRKWGGILEHPEASHAWRTFGIFRPPKTGQWFSAEDGRNDTWTCCVEQGHYGHKARKATWLYVAGMENYSDLYQFKWGPCTGKMRLDQGFHSVEERKRLGKKIKVKRLTPYELTATPIEFRDILISIARKCKSYHSDVSS